MRKISTLLTMLFLLCGVCMAQSSRLVYLKTVGRSAAGNYMSVNAAGGVVSITEKDPSALWVLNPVEGKEDTYTLRNASNAGYVVASKTIYAQWMTGSVSDATELVLEDFGDEKYGIRWANEKPGTRSYAHLDGSLKVVVWDGAGEEASTWSVEDVEGETKATVLANVEYVSKVQAAVANAEMNYANTQITLLPLITSASQFNSNNQDPEEGSYAAMLDGDNTTFFHSNWHGGGVTPHDLQVALNGNSSELKEFTVKYMARNSSGYYNNRPAAINVYGGKKVDGQVQWEDNYFVQLDTDDGLGELVGEFSFEADDVYDAFRFEVTQTVPSNTVFFTYGEFQMYSPGYFQPAKYNAAAEEDRQKLYEAIQLANDLDVTKDDYKAVYEQINAMVAEVRDNIGGESLDLLLVIDEAKAKLEALTTYENTPGQLDEESKEAWEAAIAAAQEVYDAYDKYDQLTRLNCIEAQCQLERFLAANVNSCMNVDVEALTNGFFTIENPNTGRGAIVYAPGQQDKDGNAIVDPSHENFCKGNAASEYVWYAEVADVDPTDPNHLWGFYQNPENGELYLYNVGSGLFANPNGNGTFGKTWILSQVPSPIKLEAMEAPFVHVLGEGETMSIITSYAGPVITYYADGDEGVPFQFKRVWDSNMSIRNWSDVKAQLDYNVSRPHLIDPLRGYIDFLWDMMASEKEHSAEPGHLNAAGLVLLDSVIAVANEKANYIVIADRYEDAAAAYAELKASTAAIYAAAVNYTKPENGKYYTIKSNNSSDDHYHLAHFLIQNAANDFLVVANSTGEFEKTAWLAKENDDKTFSFTNNGRYLAFGETVADPYKWTLGAPQRSDVFENDFGCLSLYGVGDGKYLAVNAETSSIIDDPVTYDVITNVDLSNGEFTKSNDRKTWHSEWTSNDAQWTYSASANNMIMNGSSIECHSGKATLSTYSVASTDGATISEITIKVRMSDDTAEGNFSTISVGDVSYSITKEEQTITIKGTSFVQTGANAGKMLLSSLTVKTTYLEPVQANYSTDFIFEEVEPSNSGDVEGGTTVGIDTIFNESAQDVYTLSGVLVRKQATNLNGLPKGVYVVGGQKVLVK